MGVAAHEKCPRRDRENCPYIDCQNATRIKKHDNINAYKGERVGG
jgi:hypothetical protein